MTRQLVKIGWAIVQSPDEMYHGQHSRLSIYGIAFRGSTLNFDGLHHASDYDLEDALTKKEG